MTTRKKLQVSSSSNNHPTEISEFKFFPPEIWIQILAKLPAKSLLKFRSLLALEGLEYRQNQWAGCLLTIVHCETLQETGLIFRKSDLYSYRIIGSCNGLILVIRNDGHPFYQKDLRLWNPCICKSLVIPTCPLPSSLLMYAVYVFGFAYTSKDYKVVTIASEKCRGEETGVRYVAVYSIRDQQWTVRNDGLNVRSPNIIGRFWPYYCLSAAVFLKGVAYWLGNLDRDGNQFSHLGSFDFDTEEFAFSGLPSSWEERGSFRHLFLLGESLAIFRISEVASSIWALDHDNKKGPWIQRFSGKSSQDGYELFRSLLNQKVFFCENDGGYFICGNKSYNIASSEVHEFKEFKSLSLQLEVYSETLVLSQGYGVSDLRFFR
ncbi:uncharacterized protein LOC141587799 [Silene latifolia]|uniref:uncharacterized protein LOC141587799 n=1 Tax=Silene latifolia TaxID=37657 RepID=UPI003D77E7EE